MRRENFPNVHITKIGKKGVLDQTSNIHEYENQQSKQQVKIAKIQFNL